MTYGLCLSVSASRTVGMLQFKGGMGKKAMLFLQTEICYFLDCHLLKFKFPFHCDLK